MQLTFRLRHGVRWHDGRPFTARDVECTWNLLLGRTAEKFQLRVPERVGFILRISFLIENQRPAAHRLVLAVATGCAGR